MEVALRRAETNYRIILNEIVSQIPAIKIGQERHEFIRMKLASLSEDVRQFIKNQLDGFLYLMQPKEASKTS